MLRAKAARRILRNVRNVTRARGTNGTTSSPEMITAATRGKIADAARAISSACNGAAVGFDLCAVRTQDQTIAVAAKSAAAFLRSLQSATVASVAPFGIDARPRVRTADRLRWEWLASTATVLDGAPDGRLAGECARILSEVDVSVASGLSCFESSQIVGGFRAALLEAHSIASAIDRFRRT